MPRIAATSDMSQPRLMSRATSRGHGVKSSPVFSREVPSGPPDTASQFFRLPRADSRSERKRPRRGRKLWPLREKTPHDGRRSLTKTLQGVTLVIGTQKSGLAVHKWGKSAVIDKGDGAVCYNNHDTSSLSRYFKLAMSPKLNPSGKCRLRGSCCAFFKTSFLY